MGCSWILGLTNLSVCQSFQIFTEQHLLYGKQETESVLANEDYLYSASYTVVSLSCKTSPLLQTVSAL